MPNIRAIHKTTVTIARAKNLFAALFILLVNPNSRVKVRPIKIVPRKARSKALIWKVYVFN
jgi:hypothetical protein